MLSRRGFLELVVSGSLGAIVLPLLPYTALGRGSRFTLCQLVYPGNWNPRPNFSSRLLAAIEMRTSVVVSREKKTLSAGAANLFEYPFIYMAGDGGFEPFTGDERARLRRYLKLGGTMFIDDATGRKHSEFDRRVREELRGILPEDDFRRIPASHAVYKSFYLLPSAAGRKIVEPYLEGITLSGEDRTPVIYSRNDIAGALEEDAFGKWEYACVPGGEPQRELAFRVAINVIVYALSGDYKTDRVHEPFIRRRQRAL